MGHGIVGDLVLIERGAGQGRVDPFAAGLRQQRFSSGGSKSGAEGCGSGYRLAILYRFHPLEIAIIGVEFGNPIHKHAGRLIGRVVDKEDRPRRATLVTVFLTRANNPP